MGTYTFYHTSHLSWKDFFYQQIENANHKIVQCSIKGRTAYLACRVVPTNEVYGLVLALITIDGDKGYKPIEEGMGPIPSHCFAPKSLIEKLTPTDSEYANQWRQQCLKNAAKPKVKPGMKIKLFNAISFTFGGKQYNDSEFLVTRLPHVRGLVFKSASSGLVRIPNLHTMDYQVSE